MWRRIDIWIDLIWSEKNENHLIDEGTKNICFWTTLFTKLHFNSLYYSRREVDDDLADEVEAIRLAADLNSRRLLAEQRKEAGGGGGSLSRTRIRALLDKQRTQRVNSSHYIISIYKVVIFVCLIVCLIITQEPLDRFASNFDWGTRKTHGNVLGFEFLSF